MSTPTPVVGCALIRDGRIFMVQRPAKKSFPFAWEVPGGKVEVGETLTQALMREVEEEVGVKIKSLGRILLDEDLDLGLWVQGATPIHYTMWIAEKWEGEPVLREKQPGMGWFDMDDYLVLKLLPANQAATAKILEVLRWGNPESGSRGTVGS